MQHVVLLGDSIFDNASYVPGGDPLIEQLRSRLPRGCRATLLAADGACISNIARQLSNVPSDASHLVVSVGGNDALQCSPVLNASITSSSELFEELAQIQTEFFDEYRSMLQLVAAAQRPTVICTIYDAIPDIGRDAVTALSIFNDSIIRAGIDAGLPILDLRFVCNESRDYSSISSIEPSEIGGSKIAREIAYVLKSHDFSRAETVIYR